MSWFGTQSYISVLYKPQSHSEVALLIVIQRTPDVVKTLGWVHGKSEMAEISIKEI